MPVQIQLRRDTAAEWANVNPVLAIAELGLETDTNKWKLGNGNTAWNSLDYYQEFVDNYTSTDIDKALSANIGNTLYIISTDAYAQANDSYAQANAAYTQANVALETVTISQNSGSTLTNKSLNFVNTSTVSIVVSDSGDGNANIEFTSAGGGGGTVKTYKYDGSLSLNTGLERMYMHADLSLTDLDAYVVTAPSGAGSKILANIKKNGTVVANISIPAGTSSNANVTPPGGSISFTHGDYVTVDIAEVGSGNPGANLYVLLSFS